MNRIVFALFLALVVFPCEINAQLDSLFSLNVRDFDSAGICFYHANSIVPGQAFDLYKGYSGDTVNGLVLIERKKDSIIGYTHYRYQQTYKGLEVEGAEFKEHAINGFVVFSNGKLCPDLDAGATPIASESEALSMVLDVEYSGNRWPWDDSDWEAQLKKDMGDTAATYYPRGKLLWAIENYEKVDYLIPDDKYRLAWRFDIRSLDPFWHRAIYVDAMTGEIFKKVDLEYRNGPADMFFHGSQIIDTKWDIGVLRWILRADNNGRDIHTKPHANSPWGLIADYRDTDDDWVGNHQSGTNAHWFAAQAWDYFAGAPYYLQGTRPNGATVRVTAEDEEQVPGGGVVPWGASYDFRSGKDIIRLGGDHAKALDVVGHEFTHGVFRLRGFDPNGEPGALIESLCDIFGELIEREVEGSFDWITGNDVAALPHRSLINPKSTGNHFVDSLCNQGAGHPDTYQGDFWESFNCGNGGLYVKTGVQNHWFYLLSQGGFGVNDHQITYSVTGIGPDDATLILWLAYNVFLSGTDDYIQASALTSLAAALIFGECSQQHRSTLDAWEAVGLPQPIVCPVFVPESYDSYLGKITAYPNPSNGKFTLDFENNSRRSLTLYSSFGQKIKEFGEKWMKTFEIDLSNYPSGVYFLKVSETNSFSTIKLQKL